MFSRTDAAIRKSFWNTAPNFARSSFAGTERTSRPSTYTAPLPAS